MNVSNTAKIPKVNATNLVQYFLAGVLTLLLTINLNAQTVKEAPPELAAIDVIPHLGESIPLDVPFVDSHGDSVMLRQYFEADKPVLLSMTYSGCSMLCSLVLDGLADGLNDLAWTPGNEFTLLNISIDTTETPKITEERKQVYLEKTGNDSRPESWQFVVGDENNIRQVSDALGFKYYYDEKLEQYAHPAVIFILTEEGIITRYLFGIQFSERDLRLALMEASQGKIGSTFEKLLLYCFHYDPNSEGYVLMATNVMKLGGAATLLIMLLTLSGFWIKESKQKKSD